MRKEAKVVFVYVLLALTIISVLFMAGMTVRTLAQTSDTSNDANLTIYDQTDDGTVKKNGWPVSFFANYTNQTTGSPIADGNCTIRFQNYSGDFNDDWDNMTYHSALNQFNYTRNFTYKGTFFFETNCTNVTSQQINLTDNFTITNFEPAISTEQGAPSWINFDGVWENHDTWVCIEDAACYYNFSSNVSDPDINDVLSFSVGTNTTIPTGNYSLGASTGMLLINVTHSNDTGTGMRIELEVSDGADTPPPSALLDVDITAVNDYPQFTNLENKTMNISSFFNYIINITDEEGNTPFTYNITFLSCSVAQWSTRDCSDPADREVFNLSDPLEYNYSVTEGTINISFTPERNDVGDYIIMFNVTDLNNDVSPFNATTSVIINFSVTNVNLPPYFLQECNGSRNTTENYNFTCYINATDIDETGNLTYTSNYTWFVFNGTGTNSLGVATNSTTNFNSSALVNFSTSDAQVGNWSVNISVADTGSPSLVDSTFFWFYVANENDSVSLDYIPNKTLYTSNTLSFLVNATDDDLLIIDETVYNETLTFAANHSSVGIAGAELLGTGRTALTISLNPADFQDGNHIINISVVDNNTFSYAWREFNLTIINNTAPSWVEPLNRNFSIDEDSNFSVNLGENVTDPDIGDTLTFSNGTAFPSFSMNTSGAINFTPLDIDVGNYLVTINVSDGITSASQVFNFTINNINDLPNISIMSGNGVTPTSWFNGSNINSSEDTRINLFIFINDSDFLIPSSPEIVTLTWDVSGPNATILESFAQDATYPNGDLTKYNASFTPQKTDKGNYTITLNATDSAGQNSSVTFTLNISEVQHSPNMTEVGNQDSSILENLTMDVNTTDTEDLNETAPGSNLTYALTGLTALTTTLLISFPINTSNGIMNFSFNSTFAGIMQFNISVTDSFGLIDFEYFNISVYDFPYILTPSTSFVFNLKENVSSELNFSVNHTVLNQLNYTLIINNVIKNSTMGNGNGTDFLWNFTAGFLDETTCTGVVNLTLNVSNAKLSNTTSWDVTINHTSFPLLFNSSISNFAGGSPHVVTLSPPIYVDSDASDSCLNQTVGFIYTLQNGSATGATISVAIANWTNAGTPSVTFSATVTGSANYSVTAYEYLNESYLSNITANITSNNFSIDFTITTTTTPQPSSGGSSNPKPKDRIISLKILVPEPVSARQKDRLIIPLGVVNDGTVFLNEIVLDAVVAKDGLLRTDLVASFDNSFIASLSPGQRENVTLIVDIDTTSTGIFEVTINATVRDPPYVDWAKLYIEINEDKSVYEKIIFTEELIIGNPECAELKEVVDAAWALFDEGLLDAALEKTNEALDACRQAISQPPSPRIFDTLGGKIIGYTALASLLAFLAGFAYYQYKRNKLKKMLIANNEKL